MKNIRLPENKFLKYFVLFWGFAIGIYFLPFILGGFLIYFIYRNINNLIIRNSILVAILLPTLLFGGIWVAGITKGATDPAPDVKVIPTQAILPTRISTPTLIPTPTVTPSVTPVITPKPSTKPTTTPVVQSVKASTPSPTYRLIIPNKSKLSPTPIPIDDPPASVQQTTTSSGFSCNCAKTCPNMISCAEAQYQLNSCGCTARDADHDGVACDAQCQ